MPKGTLPLPLAVPRKGLVQNLRPQELPPDTVIDGTNMLVDQSGLFSTRPGYGAFFTQPTVADIITGGIFFQDLKGKTWAVVSTTQKWWNLTAASANDLSPGVLAPSYRTTRFVVFHQGGTTYLLGTRDLFTSADSTFRYEVITNDGGGTFSTLAAAPKCKDLIVVGNRVVALNASTTSFRLSNQVIWSASGDSGTWPAVAIVALNDTSDAIVGGRTTGLTSGLIFRDRSLWSILAQDGGDSTAFKFELVEETIGPVSSACVVNFQNAIYYLSRDARVRRFNGQTVEVVSDAVTPLISTNLALVYPGNGLLRDNVHGVPMHALQQIWWFIPTTATQTIVVVYHPASGRWEPKQVINLRITSSFVEEGVTSYSPYGNENETLEQKVVIGTSAGNVFTLDPSYTTDNGTAIAYDWTTPTFSPGPSANYLPTEIENYFVQQPASGQTVTVTVKGWANPEALSTTPTTLISGTHDLDSGPRFQLKPATDMSFTARGRFIQATYSGSATKKVSWGGGMIYTYPEVD